MTKRNLTISVLATLCASWIVFAQYSWGTPHETSAHASQAFSIENMTCATCPITVKTAMSRVDGVQSVKIDYKSKIATAIYDPALTTATAIANASTSVGYPANKIAESQ